jgi:hypothetical protein
MKTKKHLVTNLYASAKVVAVAALIFSNTARAQEAAEQVTSPTATETAPTPAPADSTTTGSPAAAKKTRKRAPYGIESQNQCTVFILARQDSPGVAGDVFHFRDMLKQVVAKGRALSRVQSSKAGLDRIEVALAKLKEKPCPVLKEARPALGDAEVRGNPELVSLPSRFETAIQGGYIQENWKVSEKTSGSGIAAGLLLSYEFSRSGPLGILLHGVTSYEMLTLKNQAVGLVGVDSESSATRLLAGGGAGLAYHLGNNGHSRIQLLALYEMSLMGEVKFKIADAENKRDYAVSSRIRPGIRFDQMLFSGVFLGVGASYSLLQMSIPDSAGSKVTISGDAILAELGLGVSF